MKDFDLEKLERKNIYKVPENLFENIQGKVLSGLNDFDLEKLERKNIYTVPENLFENIQENVLKNVLPAKKAPIFKMNWAYAAAASLALIFGATFVFNNDHANGTENSQAEYTSNTSETKTEGEIAYETLKSDLTSVENNNQTVENQIDDKSYAQDNGAGKAITETKAETVKPVKKQNEAQVNEYLDSFSNSEISELASNSTQDVYLDLYN
ncbi:hypothetical protein J3D55_000398 [Chryseobacterium ginsenosidimutans]|uniref:hypothetical protein n=1 Tax=Chryseobacterium ginsenosidimutans TaxID=687846 RepID=UPI002167EC24|nr:hypothetical protein [Chryseobacterium ginsenosidimutans]MCS3867482.1 hypothetical protein [Chryseobacterium ginsenosidimutans]